MAKPTFDEIVALLRRPELRLTDEANGRLLWAAIKAFDPEQPAAFAAMLESPDPEVLNDALYILYETHTSGYAVADQAIKHLDPPIYFKRLNVLCGLVGSAERLSPHQIAQCLVVTEDNHPVIRGHMAALLSKVESGALQHALDIARTSGGNIADSETDFLLGAQSVEMAMEALESRGAEMSCYAAALLIKSDLQQSQEARIAALSANDQFALALTWSRNERKRWARRLAKHGPR